jgi:membrane protease subunit (stomatin/prohibitin family)
MKRTKVVLSVAAVVLIGAGTGVGLAATSHTSSAGGGFVPLPAGMAQQEPVSKAVYAMCQATVNPSAAEVASMPSDQRTELLAVEDWCQSFAVRTNPHKG